MQVELSLWDAPLLRRNTGLSGDAVDKPGSVSRRRTAKAARRRRQSDSRSSANAHAHKLFPLLRTCGAAGPLSPVGTCFWRECTGVCVCVWGGPTSH